MEEEESYNLYCAMENSPCYHFDVNGLLTLGGLFLSSIEGGLGGDIRWPTGPGFLVLAISIEGSIYDCCNTYTQQYETWAEGTLEVALSYELGKTIKGREERVKGNQRNTRVPHPCKLGATVKKKDFAKALEECNRKRLKREKNQPLTMSKNVLKKCPEKWWDAKGSIFVRGRIGVGFGGSFSVSYQLTSPNERFLDNIEAKVSVGWVGAGASIEAGGGGTFAAAMKLRDATSL